MTTPLPDRVEIDDACKLIDDNCQSIYTWRYERDRPQLVTLYEKAAHSQWVGSTDLDWSTDVDPESLVDLDAPNLAKSHGCRARPSPRGVTPSC